MATPAVAGKTLAKGGPVLSAAAVEKWIEESLASAPPPEKMHMSTHLKSCIPALLDSL